MNYNNKKFKPVENTANGETTGETIFEYKQDGNILTSEYQGGQIEMVLKNRTQKFNKFVFNERRKIKEAQLSSL